MNLKDLEKRNADFYKGFVFARPNTEYGVLGWEINGNLYIDNWLINEISSVFGLKDFDIRDIISRWVGDRLKLDVENAFGFPLIYIH